MNSVWEWSVLSLFKSIQNHKAVKTNHEICSPGNIIRKTVSHSNYDYANKMGTS